MYRLIENFNTLFLNFPHNCVALPLNFAKNRLTQTLANYWFSICQHLFSGNNFFLLNFQQIFSITWLRVRNFPAAFYNFLRFQSQSFALFFSLSFCLIFQFIHILSLAFFSTIFLQTMLCFWIIYLNFEQLFLEFIIDKSANTISAFYLFLFCYGLV